MNRTTHMVAGTFLFVLSVGCGPSNPNSTSQPDVQSPSAPVGSADVVSDGANDASVSALPSGEAPAQTQGSNPVADSNLSISPDEPWVPQSDWEKQLMAEMLVDVRDGVQLYGEDAFGLCRKGDNNLCGEYLGPTPGVLEPGEYYVFAQVQAPSVAEGWKVVYTSNCGLTSGGGTSLRPNAKEREYPVKYKERRAYPVRMPSVVAPGGSSDSNCEITLDSLGPGGERQRIAEGQFIVPAE